MSASRDLRAAVAFLTPVGGGSAQPSPAAMAWFPLVGAVTGWVLGGFWQQTRKRLPPLLAAALTLVADGMLTGALHLDGLADAADGLLAHAPRRSRLEIMADPAIGAFGAVAVSLATLSRAASLSAIAPSPALLAALYCSSRSAMVLASRLLPYARGEGLASGFLPGSRAGQGPSPTTGRYGLALDPALGAGLAGAVSSFALARWRLGKRGARAVLAGWAGAAAVAELARRRLGGFSGDVLGAAAVICETAGLVAAAGKAQA